MSFYVWTARNEDGVVLDLLLKFSVLTARQKYTSTVGVVPVFLFFVFKIHNNKLVVLCRTTTGDAPQTYQRQAGTTVPTAQQ